MRPDTENGKKYLTKQTPIKIVSASTRYKATLY